MIIDYGSNGGYDQVIEREEGYLHNYYNITSYKLADGNTLYVQKLTTGSVVAFIPTPDKYIQFETGYDISDIVLELRLYKLPVLEEINKKTIDTGEPAALYL